MFREWKTAGPHPEYTAPMDHWQARVGGTLEKMGAPQSLLKPTLEKLTDTNCKTPHIPAQAPWSHRPEGPTHLLSAFLSARLQFLFSLSACALSYTIFYVCLMQAVSVGLSFRQIFGSQHAIASY
ncbi:hypothetical protein ATPR_1328 [Acetobacter tropicalis NBRC 101654]|uniref:Uncharacterized protein n=1 Tax=Acetobacter tropicalis NBRC 101654 TaxID=749388 RepID=F7VD79_9PROT|nr:hypothetical protein ATPR_1328 [Acetobacter tropicalis NBRC 101654]